MALLKYFAVVLTVCVGVALGYSTGAPADACHDLIPQHPATAQSTPLPYTFILSKAAVRAGETIKVTVRGNGPSDKIAGFMLQARDGTLPIGTFKVIEPTKSQLLKCNYNAVSSREMMPGRNAFIYNLFNPRIPLHMWRFAEISQKCPSNGQPLQISKEEWNSLVLWRSTVAFSGRTSARRQSTLSKEFITPTQFYYFVFQ